MLLCLYNKQLVDADNSQLHSRSSIQNKNISLGQNPHSNKGIKTKIQKQKQKNADFVYFTEKHGKMKSTISLNLP